MRLRSLGFLMMLSAGCGAVGDTTDPAAPGAGDPQSEHEAGAADKDQLQICPPALCPPDLKVVEDDRAQWKWDPGTKQWYPAYAQGFSVSNVGTGAAGSFPVAVLRGADSYSFTISSLAVGASQYYQLIDLRCAEPVTVVVNALSVLPEPNHTNNAVAIRGACYL